MRLLMGLTNKARGYPGTFWFACRPTQVDPRYANNVIRYAFIYAERDRESRFA